MGYAIYSLDKQGEYHRNYSQFHFNDQEYWTVRFDHGKKTGRTKYYDSTGVLFLECGYKNGEMHGELIKYNSSGDKLSAISFNNGKKDGANREFYTTGELKRNYFFRNDTLVEGYEYDSLSATNGIFYKIAVSEKTVEDSVFISYKVFDSRFDEFGIELKGATENGVDTLFQKIVKLDSVFTLSIPKKEIEGKQLIGQVLELDSNNVVHSIYRYDLRRLTTANPAK